jgi:hypothetical protein
MELGPPIADLQTQRPPLQTSPPADFSTIYAPTMPPSSRFLVVSLPTSITSSQSKGDALSALKATVGPDNGTTNSFPVPAFKIGTLDALVQQADDLTKLNAASEAVVSKVAESLRGILDGDEDKIAQQKTINDSTLILDIKALHFPEL